MNQGLKFKEREIILGIDLWLFALINTVAILPSLMSRLVCCNGLQCNVR